MRDVHVEHLYQEFSHASRKGTFIRAHDLARFLAKPVPKSSIVQATVEAGGIRKPRGDECPEEFVPVSFLKDHRPEVFGLAPKKVTRPDKAAAKAGRKFEQERVAKCGLHKHLSEKSLGDAIRARVRAVSEATNLAGIMLLDIVLRNMDRGTRVPDFTQIFCRQVMLRDMENPHVRESVAECFTGFAPVERFMGDGQLYTSAALAMEVNFRNSIVFSFEQKQKRYVREWCSKAPQARGESWPIVKAINNWGTPERLTEEGARFAASEREALGNPPAVAATWLSSNVETVLRTYRRWLVFLESHDAKLFSLTPYWGIRSHFIKLDTDAMYGLMKSEGLYRGNLAAFKEDAVTQFESVFKLSGLLSKKWTFSRMVETDGVALCVHFKRPKSDEELVSMEAAEAKRARNNVVASEKRATRARSPERVEAEFAAAKAAKAEAARVRANQRAKEARQRKKLGIPEPEKPSKKEAPARPTGRPVLRDGDLSQDPGNNPNVTYTVHIVNGRKVKKRFTIGRYYTQSGVKRLQKRTGTWLRGVQRHQDTVDEVSLKTAVHASVRVHIRRYAAVHGALWDEKTKSRWARGRFDTYIRKPATLDKFFGEIKKAGPVVRSFYGGASCSSSIPGTKPAPKTLCLRRAKMAFPGTAMVDEYLTTQLCWMCLQRTQPVATWVNGRARSVRGLVYCDSSTCGCFRDRDFQGALNIMACGVGPRPPELARTEGHVRRTDRRFIPTPMRKQCALRRQPTRLRMSFPSVRSCPTIH